MRRARSRRLRSLTGPPWDDGDPVTAGMRTRTPVRERRWRKAIICTAFRVCVLRIAANDGLSVGAGLVVVGIIYVVAGVLVTTRMPADAVVDNDLSLLGGSVSASGVR